MAKVTVYYFECWDIKTDKYTVQKRMATRKFIDRLIEGGASCKTLMNSAKEVDSSEVDENGRYPITVR
jgi:hypothetical protein